MWCATIIDNDPKRAVISNEVHPEPQADLMYGPGKYGGGGAKEEEASQLPGTPVEDSEAGPDEPQGGGSRPPGGLHASADRLEAIKTIAAASVLWERRVVGRESLML